MPDFNQFALNRLTNLGNAAEGTNLPPRQTGDIRVPIVTNLKVVGSTPTATGPAYVLSWLDPDAGGSQISQYNIYVIGDGTEEPQGPFTARRSPATVRVAPVTSSQLRFIVQTQLHNGMTSHMEISPSVASPTTTSSSGLTLLVTRITSNYTVTSYNYMIAADTTSGNITVTLPVSPAVGDTYCIKKMAAANTLTITPTAGTIDGAASVASTLIYQSYTVIYTGAEWSII